MTTNTIFGLIGLVLLTMRLLNDFHKDKGQNKKAKVFQAVILGLIVANYASSIRYIGWLFRHYDKALEKFTVDVGIVSGYIHFKIFLLNIVLMVALIIIAFLMASRHQKARQFLFYLLPVFALTEIFNFYKGWLNDGEASEINHGIIFWIAFTIFGGIATSILLIYNSKFMRAFFDFKIPEIEKKINDI